MALLGRLLVLFALSSRKSILHATIPQKCATTTLQNSQPIFGRIHEYFWRKPKSKKVEG